MFTGKHWDNGIGSIVKESQARGGQNSPVPFSGVAARASLPALAVVLAINAEPITPAREEL